MKTSISNSRIRAVRGKLINIPRPLLLLCVVLCLNALPALADWASAESPDFTVDTTVPEPCMFMMAVCGVFLLARKARARTLGVLAMIACFAMAALQTHAALPVVSNVTAQQQPWPSTSVDIYYDLYDADGDTQSVYVAVSTNSIDPFRPLYDVPATHFSGDYGIGVTTGTHKHITWDAYADIPDYSNSTTRVRVMANDSFLSNQYLVIDVSGGPDATNYPVTYLSSQPVPEDEHKTTKIVLRKIPAGSFVMGSPANELGRLSNESPQHNVTLTKPFYIGIYGITQAQYSNVMGSNPSSFTQGAHALKRPVESVSWNTVRGGMWPGGTPSNTTFMGTLRSKTGLNFDLPTEAQWEYACRAGTTKALNNNTDLQGTDQDANMDILGRYWHNGGNSGSSDPVNGGTAAVGSYQVNNWGLYDMHGNVWDWCLDWYASSYGGDATDPNGPVSGSNRVIRGGRWRGSASLCRSASRIFYYPASPDDNVGFRLVLPAGQ